MSSITQLWLGSAGSPVPSPAYTCPAGFKVLVYTAQIMDQSGDGGLNYVLIGKTSGRAAFVLHDSQTPGVERSLVTPAFVLEAGDTVTVVSDSTHYSTYGSGVLLPG